MFCKKKNNKKHALSIINTAGTKESIYLACDEMRIDQKNNVSSQK